MSRLSPSLEDVSLSYAVFIDGHAEALPDDAWRALLNLVSFCASGLVWTYSPPGDGSLPDDDDKLARLCGVSRKRWRRIRPQVAVFFVIRRGRWHLDREWLRIESNGGRAAIPLSIQREVAAREGKRCTYCGTTEGPFHFDHIFPVSRGGTNDASNLTVACEACNLSKSDMTLAEWFASARAAARLRSV